MTLDELLALADAATPGPWHRGRGWDDEERTHTEPIVFVEVGEIGCEELPASDADAAYIAALSPERVKALVEVAMAAQDPRGDFMRARWAGDIGVSRMTEALANLDREMER